MEPPLQQILTVWRALEMRKQIIVVAATLAMFAAVLGLARMAANPSMALLYAGLEAGAAGEVVTALEARGALHEVRGGAIYVDLARRDELRMTLAAEGLPANSVGGYELLDNLSGFGTTSQMFDAAYWRAKEGELARTIVAAPRIETARVHIGAPSANGMRTRATPTGSVTVTTSGDGLGPAQARALKYLVASAVPGLAPEDVSVIDARNGLILSGDESGAARADGGDRAEALKHNVERLIEARVGVGNAVVEVTVDTALESETIVERTLDPDSRVAISIEVEETSTSATDSRAGAVTIASNLPAGDGAAGDGESRSNDTGTRERTNYEVSELTREVQRGPGTIRRITVAVLVDGLQGIDAAGNAVWTPRPDDELAALRDLVASAVGFDESRGDTITIKSMEFQPTAIEGTTAERGLFANWALDAMALARIAALVVVALILGLFVVRPILSDRGAADPARIAPPDRAADPDPTTPPALTGEIDDGSFPVGADMAVVSDLDPADRARVPALGHGAAADPVDRLRALIAERQSETVEILRGWMEDETGEKA